MKRDLSDTPPGSAAVRPCIVLICFSTCGQGEVPPGLLWPLEQDTGGINCSLPTALQLGLGLQLYSLPFSFTIHSKFPSAITLAGYGGSSDSLSQNLIPERSELPVNHILLEWGCCTCCSFSYSGLGDYQGAPRWVNRVPHIFLFILIVEHYFYLQPMRVNYT